MAPAREDLFNVPNLLSLVRIGSIPFMLIMLYQPGRLWAWLASGLFFVAGLTDLFDGILARRLKKVTVLGQFLDPVSDKLLIASLLITLTDLDRAAAWMTVVVIGREIAVTGMRALASAQGFTVPSDYLGKLKTTIQMLAVFLLILPSPLGGADLQGWGTAVLWVAVVLTAWSGLSYFVSFKRSLGLAEVKKMRDSSIDNPD